jgi:hypothetical protein
MQYINCATIIQTPPALDSYLLNIYYLAVEVSKRHQNQQNAPNRHWCHSCRKTSSFQTIRLQVYSSIQGRLKCFGHTHL